MYRDLGVLVYVIQQPSRQPHENVNVLYKKLLNDGQLTDAKLRNLSITRKYHDEYQKPLLDVFARFNRTRGFTVIRIDDVVCDDEVCAIGTSRVPFFTDLWHMSWAGAARLTNKIQGYLAL
jgi:hypothetical protein